MTIASEIARIQGNIADAYNSCAAKGATMPATNNSASLANTIDSISAGGGGDIGTLGIGTYYVNNGVAMPQAGDVSDAFKSIVSIEANAMRNACQNMNITGIVNFANLTTVNKEALNSCFKGCKYITGVNFGKLTFFTNMNGCFQGCSNLVSFDFNHEAEIAFGWVNSLFNRCYNLSGIMDFSKQSSIWGTFDGYSNMLAYTNISFLNMYNTPTMAANAFSCACYNCANLTGIDFHNLQNVTGNYAFHNAFDLCANLTGATFPSLSKINYSMVFAGCFAYSGIKDIYFNALTTTSFGSYSNQFRSMLTSVTNCNVHFPATIQSTIGSWTDVTSGFGGTNTTVLFDL